MNNNSELHENSKREIEAQISNCYAQVSKYSGHLSNIFRQLAFAEGALFWFSKINFNASNLLLIIGFSILIFYFILDALQYFSGLLEYEKIAKKFHHDYKDNKIYDLEKYDMEPPKYIDVFFYLKLITLVLASVILIYSFINGYTCSEFKS